MSDRNIEATAVARAVGALERQFRAWSSGTAEPAPADVFDIERVLGLAPGELSHHLGYVPVGRLGADRPLADVVERSELLDDEAKRMVLGIIRVLVARSQMRLSVVPTRGLRPERRAGKPGANRAAAVSTTLEDLRAEWSEVLRQEGATKNTIENYRSAVEQLRLFLAREERSVHAYDVTQVDIQEWLAGLLMRNSPSTVTSRYRALRVFFAWLVDVGEISVNPMVRIAPPSQAFRETRHGERQPRPDRPRPLL